MDDYIQMVRDRLETLSQSPEEMRAYTRYSKALSDYVSNVNGARREGRIEGEKAGRIEGEKAGELSNKIKTAKIALAKGYSVTEITELTGLSAEEIAGL
jgi:predicted transposase/invertase (TIGR01784 family)